MVIDLNKRLEDKGIKIRLTDRTKDYIVERSYDPVYGARPLKRFLQKNVETLSARLILNDQVQPEDTIVIEVENNSLVAIVERLETRI
jgi:ATP-dependent Clp protease ATP-binding subunit ClpB